MLNRDWRGDAARRTDLGYPGEIDERTRAFMLRRIRPLVSRAFRPVLEGAEHLPSDRPYLIVSNHSGLGNADVLVLSNLFVERLDAIGPVAFMVHPISYDAWPQGPWLQRLGAIPSTRHAVRRALDAGVPVLMMPGGDHEAQRPVWQASRVDFAGRKGFLELAREARIPIVPMGIAGSHFTAPVLWRSRHVLPWLFIWPRLMGVKRAALSLLGLMGALAIFAWCPAGSLYVTALAAWLWIASPLATLPWIPWKISVRIGRPLTPGELFDDERGGSLDAAYRRVECTVQRLVRK